MIPPGEIEPRGLSNPWTVDLVERAKLLWGLKWSAKDIAADLGNGLTRNAVIGKLCRLGLQRREVKDHTTPRKPPRKPVARIDHIMNRAANAAEPEPLPLDVPMDDAADLIRTEHSCDIMGLSNRTCRWPCGTPGEASFFYCGRPEADYAKGRAYCRAHTLRSRGRSLTVTEAERQRRHIVGSRSLGAVVKRLVGETSI